MDLDFASFFFSFTYDISFRLHMTQDNVFLIINDLIIYSLISAVRTLRKHVRAIYFQYFTAVKMVNFRWKKCDIFLIFAQ